MRRNHFEYDVEMDPQFLRDLYCPEFKHNYELFTVSTDMKCFRRRHGFKLPLRFFMSLYFQLFAPVSVADSFNRQAWKAGSFNSFFDILFCLMEISKDLSAP